MSGREAPSEATAEKEMKGEAVSVWRSWVKAHPFLVIALAALPFYVLGLCAPALHDGEGMYAEIAREMRLTGDWITPHLNGTRHFDKPPFTYWMAGIGQSLLGETESAARLFPSLAAWGMIPVTGSLAAALFGLRAGWMSALVLASSVGLFIFGRMLMPDPFLCFWTALAMLGYVRGYVRPRGEGWKNPWSWVMFGALGFASLTKGIVGTGLPSAIIGLHVLLTGQIRSFLSLRSLGGAVLTALIALPWIFAVSGANPDFLGYFFIREHLLRFTGKRYPPDEFLSLPVFLTLTLTWTFPWICFIPQALWRSIKRLRDMGMRRSDDLLLLLWILVIVGLFSASRSRLEYYALPSIPAFAILIGRLWDELLTPGADAGVRKGCSWALGSLALVSVLLALLSFVVLGPWKEVVCHAIVRSWPESGWGNSPDQLALLERIRIPTIVTLTGIAAFTVAALTALVRARPKGTVGLMASMMIPVFGMVYWGFLVMEPFMTTKTVAEIVREKAGASDLVIFQEPHEYMWVGSMAYYSKRYVHILKDPKFEGVAARRREPAERFIDREALKELWSSHRRVIVVAERDGDVPGLIRVIRPLEILGGGGTKVVLANGPAETGTGRE